MEYEIYIDSVFFSNFALNFLVLTLAGRGLKIKNGLRRRLIGSFVGALFYCICLMLPIPFMWLRICIGSLGAGLFMANLSFGASSKKGLKRCMEEIMLYSLIMGGIMFCVNRFFPFLGGLFGTISMALGSFEIIRRVGDKWRNQRNLLGNAMICHEDKKINVKALLDTGNGLLEPISQKPVCVVNKKVADLLWEDIDNRLFRAIPYHSVGCSAGILKGYLVEELNVEYEGRLLCVKDLYLAVKEETLGTNGDYDLIVNPRILQK